ncbi:DUF4870 domain-containing protein [Tenacibaculum sp. SG-28]|uniref:DUF4870 domain-containing protein n=1 Tax=Tenacibaculum sp. SG-28 TaxID=754426 RepID=UPI000CF4391B|nr:DUF4870 domain-containing protein [Tenacibaculum sp. SG-28]PQJ19677.1 hypothetical protein BSU00_11920 [Tenacibaculum sp. SG-28]
MQKNTDNTNAFLLHISSFAGYLFPLGSIITPLIIWQTLKDKSPILDEHGKEAVNFNISFGIYIFILSASFFTFIFRNLFDIIDGVNVDFGNHHSYHGIFNFFGVASVVAIIGLIKVALVIIAAMKASNGEVYKYPLTINFIK